MAHASQVVCPAPLRRCIAGIFRPGLLIPRDADVIVRLLRDPRSALRYLVGAGIIEFDENTARLASAQLAARGVMVDTSWLLARWRAALRHSDPWSPADKVTSKAAGFNGATDAADLAECGIPQWTRALLVLCGATPEHIPAPAMREVAA